MSSQVWSLAGPCLDHGSRVISTLYAPNLGLPSSCCQTAYNAHLHVQSCCKDRRDGAAEAVTRQKQRQLSARFFIAADSLQEVDQLIEQANPAAVRPVEERCIEPIMHTCNVASDDKVQLACDVCSAACTCRRSQGPLTL